MVRQLFSAGVLLIFAALAYAQEQYPSRALTMIVPYPPGGVVDLGGRPLAAAMEKVLKQPIVVSNRQGAAGAVGIAAAANAKPDGYTLLVTASSISVIPEADRLFERKPAYTTNQLIPVALISADPIYLAVRSESPWKSIRELVAEARQRQGQMSFSSSGVYGAVHLPMEMFLHAEKLKMRHVPTNGGGPAITALLGGHVDMTGGGPASLSTYIRSGKLRALAGTGKQRHELLPEVPTLLELGDDVEYYIWVGLFAPADTREVPMKVLREAVRKAVQDPDFKAALANLSTPVMYLDAPEFRKFWDRDARRLAGVVRTIGRVEEQKQQ